MGRKKKEPIFTGTPDDSFSAAGMTMERFGRYSVARVHRTPEEQALLQKGLWEDRANLYRQIEQANEEILEIINRYQPFQVVAGLFVAYCIHNPDRYRETEGKLRPHFVEHAAMLELKNAQWDLKRAAIRPIDGRDMQRVDDLLNTVFTKAVWYYIGEAFDPSQEARTPLMEMRFMTILQGMVVRAPAYTQHWRAVLSGLSKCGAANNWLLKSRGYSFLQALDFANGLEQMIATQIDLRLEEARQSWHQFEKELAAFKAGRLQPEDEDRARFLAQFKNADTKDAITHYKLGMVNWVVFGLPLVLSFSSAEVADGAEVEEGVAAAFLDDFSQPFGSTPKEYELPSPSNSLHERPLISFDSRSFCPVPQLLEWAVKPRLESLLTQSPAWEAYNRHRAAFLIDEACACFQRIFPNGRIYKSLYYDMADGGQAELDALLLFDRYVFVIEGKAGSFGDAKRGGKPRLLKQLTQLVGDPAAQARRASDYVRQSPRPEFRTKAGEILQVNKNIHSEIAEVLLTLDNLDLYTADLFKLRGLGLVGGDDLPWAVCLTDLMAISEVISRPSELLHFLRWRRVVNRSEDVTAMADELNWLAVYFKEGPRPPTSPTGSGVVQYASYLDPFDAYFLYTGGARSKPAHRPAQYLPERFDALLRALEKNEMHGFTEAVEFLYDLSSVERARLASLLRDFKAVFRKRAFSELTLDTVDKAVRLVLPGQDSSTLHLEAARLARGMKKDVLIIQMTYSNELVVTGWSISGKLKSPQ